VRGAAFGATLVTRVAALDCGTNSLRLLIADVDAVTGSLTDVAREMRIVRLGQGVDKTRRFADEALARTFAVCEEYAAMIAVAGVPAAATRFVATSASRDATNRDEFFAGVRRTLGVEAAVITGDEEAALSFAGATRELLTVPGVAAPYLVVDIGGGSTEFVLGNESVDAARSVDVGCVRLTERHLHHDPATPAEISAIRSDVLAAIDLVREVVPVAKAATLVGLAGSVTTIAALSLGLATYDPTAIHHARLSFDDVHAVTSQLLAMTRAERAALPVMHAGRVDVIGAGALVLDTIMSELGRLEVVVSEHDILDGIAFSI
jgi:exopolyphosphatase/guanosine-5'-triphosphate,3'-diphosphate pyrophosphatase